MSAPCAKVIVNPVAGGGSASREWPQISACLRKIGLFFDCEFTEGPGHAIEVARKAASAGYPLIISVGGDGTANEAVNGILTSPSPSGSVLAIICAGTLSSAARSLGIPRDYASACSLLIGGRRTLVDAGIVRYQSGGTRPERFFLNEASAGFGALVLRAGDWLPNWFGRKTKYKLRRITGYGALAAHRNTNIRLCLGSESLSFRGCYVVAANGRYFADGMQIAPHAQMNDGLLDVVTVGDTGKLELLKEIVPAVYKGSHIGHPKISERQAATITVECDEKLLVEADGEILGTTPASFTVLPSALTVVA